MKDQYFGDQTDYIKYGILQFFAAESNPPLAVHWARTLDDGSNDGRRIKYLSNPEAWRFYNPALFDCISAELSVGRRELNCVREHDFLPNAQLCFDEWTSDTADRLMSIESLLQRLEKSSLIFIDPDNGLSTPAIKPGSPLSRKYVFLDELARVWNAGHSVALYQHFPRVTRTPYILAQMERLGAEFGRCEMVAIRTSHVAFILCFQGEHAGPGLETAAKAGSHWAPHTATLALTKRGELDLISKPVGSAPKPQAELPW